MKALGKALSYLLGAALPVAIVVIAVWSDRLHAGYRFNNNMAVAAASTVTALLAVTLFVERAMAVFNAILFGEEHRQAEAKMLGDAPAQGAKDMTEVLGKKERVRLFGAFLAGAFVSAAGVRTLEGLLAPDQNWAANPFFFPVDVVLTAGLIAGGSNGLAFLLQVIKDVLAPPEQANEPAPASAPPDKVDGKAGSPGAAAARSRFFRARMTTG